VQVGCKCSQGELDASSAVLPVAGRPIKEQAVLQAARFCSTPEEVDSEWIRRLLVKRQAGIELRRDVSVATAVDY